MSKIINYFFEENGGNVVINKHTVYSKLVVLFIVIFISFLISISPTCAYEIDDNSTCLSNVVDGSAHQDGFDMHHRLPMEHRMWLMALRIRILV